MAHVLSTLQKWVATLPRWQQAAFAKVVAQPDLGEEDYEELMGHLLEEYRLVPARAPRPRPTLRALPGTNQEGAPPLYLESIENLRNVNALVPGQRLTFGPGLTVIYGANGSGKSGYARLLGCAGFSRGDQDVLPDVTMRSGANEPCSAEIALRRGHERQRVQYTVGAPCPELASLYVFDTTSVRVHITRSNSLSFSPAGLDCLTRLVDVVDEMRRRMKALIAECTPPNQFIYLFPGDTLVAQAVADLGPQTDVARLRRMATLTPAERQRVDDLGREIAILVAKNIPAEIQSTQRMIGDLRDLLDQLRTMQERLGESTAVDVGRMVDRCIAYREQTQQMSVSQFQTADMAAVGSDTWQQFVRAARSLAGQQGTPADPYPQDESHCLLCGQPLSAEARDLLNRLWDYLASDAQTRLSAAERVLRDRQGEIAGVRPDVFGSQTAGYRCLEARDGEALYAVRRFVEIGKARQEALLQHIRTYEAQQAPQLPALPPLPEGCFRNVQGVIARLEKQCAELEWSDPTQEIGGLEYERLELEHRALLAEHLPDIEAYLKQLAWTERAKAVSISTSKITRKYNDLFSQMVTDRYVDAFRARLQELGRPIKVRIAAQGSKGRTYKQISLELSSTSPDKVLSEGEKRAVALADFLTEVSLDSSSSGIVLDDPVTSLDLEWRHRIAAMLAREADRRQVIVFTHDLPFLYYLRMMSEQERVEMATHWIKRGDADGKPGYVYLDNSPVLEHDYRHSDRARALHAEALAASPAEQGRLLRDGFAALRTTYEAFIIFEMLNGVVTRFSERIRLGRLGGVVWDGSIVERVIAKYRLLSGYIEGHLHSDMLVAGATPQNLLHEIKEYEALRRELESVKARTG